MGNVISYFIQHNDSAKRSSFYVILTSSKPQKFPDNSPSHFHYRLPQTLWLPGKWKVGLASLFLPGAPNPIPHVVTSHTSPSLTVRHEAEQRPTRPFSYQSLLHLYKGRNTITTICQSVQEQSIEREFVQTQKIGFARCPQWF